MYNSEICTFEEKNLHLNLYKPNFDFSFATLLNGVSFSAAINRWNQFTVLGNYLKFDSNPIL